MKEENKAEVITKPKRKSRKVKLEPVITSPYQMGLVPKILNKRDSIKFIKDSKPKDVFETGILPYFNALHSAEVEIKVLSEAMTENEMFIRAAGIEMMHHPFIPQYIGFQQTSKDGSIVYFKGDFFLTQDNSKWKIVHGGEVVTFNFLNMFDAFAVLRSMGCDIDIAGWQQSGGGETVDFEAAAEAAKKIDAAAEESK